MAVTAAVLDKIIGFLAPLFLEAPEGDITAARETAQATLASYEARNNRELRLAALAIAFGFGALDALSRAADRDMALNQVMRLRGNANALNRAAVQNENRLEKLRRQPAEDPAAEPEPDAADEQLPASSATPDLIAFACSALTSMMGRATPATPQPALQATPQAAPRAAPLSRQQRRAAERQAEKVRRSLAEAARLAERANQRLARRAEAEARLVSTQAVDV